MGNNRSILELVHKTRNMLLTLKEDKIENTEVKLINKNWDTETKDRISLTGHILGKGDRRQWATSLTNLNGGPANLEKGEKVLKATRDRELWRVMIAYVPKEHVT